MSVTFKTTGVQATIAQLRKELGKMRNGAYVTVGIHESAGAVESGEITMAQLGAVHEFGALINHPGGTSYGYASQSDAEDGKVRFLKSGQGFMQLGTTGPHNIDIPARPWLRPGVEKATPDIISTIESGVEAGSPMNMVLQQVGVVTAGVVQEYMTDLKTPPNAESTVRQKGSSNPLIDSGAMRASVTWAIQNGKPQEGIG